MKKIKNRITLIVAIGAVSLLVTGCKNPAEKAADQAADSIEDNADNSADKTENKSGTMPNKVKVEDKTEAVRKDAADKK